MKLTDNDIAEIIRCLNAGNVSDAIDIFIGKDIEDSASLPDDFLVAVARNKESQTILMQLLRRSGFDVNACQWKLYRAVPNYSKDIVAITMFLTEYSNMSREFLVTFLNSTDIKQTLQQHSAQITPEFQSMFPELKIVYTGQKTRSEIVLETKSKILEAIKSESPDDFENLLTFAIENNYYEIFENMTYLYTVIGLLVHHKILGCSCGLLRSKISSKTMSNFIVDFLITSDCDTFVYLLGVIVDKALVDPDVIEETIYKNQHLLEYFSSSLDSVPEELVTPRLRFLAAELNRDFQTMDDIFSSEMLLTFKDFGPSVPEVAKKTIAFCVYISRYIDSKDANKIFMERVSKLSVQQQKILEAVISGFSLTLKKQTSFSFFWDFKVLSASIVIVGKDDWKLRLCNPFPPEDFAGFMGMNDIAMTYYSGHVFFVDNSSENANAAVRFVIENRILDDSFTHGGKFTPHMLETAIILNRPAAVRGILESGDVSDTEIAAFSESNPMFYGHVELPMRAAEYFLSNRHGLFELLIDTVPSYIQGRDYVSAVKKKYTTARDLIVSRLPEIPASLSHVDLVSMMQAMSSASDELDGFFSSMAAPSDDFGENAIPMCTEADMETVEPKFKSTGERYDFEWNYTNPFKDSV